MTTFDNWAKPEEIKTEHYYAPTKNGNIHIDANVIGIRVTHIPTGLFVECHTERSKIKNKFLAMELLKEKLFGKAAIQTFVFDIKSMIHIKAETLDEAVSQFADQVRASASDLDFELNEEETNHANLQM